MKLKLILCDFDGVLYNFDKNNIQDGMYCGIKNKDITLYKNIKNFLFGQGKFIFYAWMRGYINHNDLHIMMANKFNTNVEFLNNQLIESIKIFNLNWNLINFISEYRKKGVKVHIVTDNLTTFNDLLVPYFDLYKYFDKIYSSSEYHIMKKDEENKWIKDIITENNSSNEETLFIDDGEELINNLDKVGIKTYLYNCDTRFNFEEWFLNNIK